MTTTIEKPRNRKRRGRNEGSIFQRTNGLWVATISLGYGADGKRRRRTVYGETKAEVQERLSKLQSSSSTGTLPTLHKETVSQFLTRWLADVAKPTLRSTTFANYNAIVKNHIGRRIGGVKLQKLTPAHVQGLYAEMDRDGVGAHPRRLAHAVLRRALSHALRQGLIVRNVCDAVEPPKVPKSKIMPLDQKQVAALLDAAKGDRLEALYHLAIGSGMREGEMFGLHWSSLDLAAGTVSVKQSLAEVGGKLSVGEPKSGAARRQIGLPQHAIKALEAHRRRQMAAGFGGCEFVFCNQSGGPMRRSHFHAGDFKPLLRKAGLPDCRFHDLRHTHATLCLLAGENPKVVQERLGHANISITLDTYSHVLPSMKAGTAAKLDAIVATAMAEHEIGCTLAVKAG
ncbi:MAG: site-specific integrase [Pirellulales bacterium]